MVLSEDSTACRFIKSRHFLLLGLLLFTACAETKKEPEEILPFYNTAEFDAEWIKEEDSSYSKIHTVDTFSLTNQSGKTITKASLDGHIYVANFFFTICSGICPKMTSNLEVLQNIFADNEQIKMVSFSVMPWADSVSVLKEYGRQHKINPDKWYLLTGEKEKIYQLARTSYFAEKGLGLKKTTDQFLHTESMLLIDKKGRIRGIYNATQKPDIERVTDDIKVLLQE